MMTEKAKRLSASYPPGTRIELRDMVNNEPGMPSGLRGTVIGCDGQPALLMRWDNGRTLSLLMEDSYRRLRPDEIEAEQYGNITAVCDKKLWLGNYREYPASDYPYTFEEVEDLETLTERMEHGNWALRTCFMYNGLAFVQQVNGGDEWLALYQHEVGQWASFDSISLEHILERDGAEEFQDYVQDLADSIPRPIEDQDFGGMGGMA